MLGLWTVISGCLALVMGLGRLILWADANPNMASWVQAIGSIGAIVAAGWGIYWGQGRQERRHIEAEKTRKSALLHTAFQLVHGSAETLKQICDDDNLATPLPVDLMTLQRQFDGLSHALRKVDLSAFADFKIIEAIVTTDAVIRKMTLLLETVVKTRNSLMLEWVGVRGEAVHAYSLVKARATLLLTAVDDNQHQS